MLSALVAAIIGFFLIGAIRRLYFHPLSHVPGPKLAALTWWYEIYYDVYLPGQYVFRIQKLHEIYGPIVRITPDDVHVNNLQHLDYIYAGPNKVRHRPGSGNIDFGDSLAGTSDFYLHRQRRKAMGSFFGRAAIGQLEHRIQAKIDRMCTLLDRHVDQKSIVNLSDLFYGLAWDVVFEYCFGIDAGLLLDETACAQVRHNIRTLLLGANFNRHFGRYARVLSSLPVLGKYFIPSGVGEMIRINQIVGENIKTALSDEEDELRPQTRSIIYEIRRDPRLSPGEKSFRRLQREGSFMVLAGTESTAASLKVIMFHILSNPHVLRKVRDEVDRASQDKSNRKGLSLLEQLPYLTACIHEGNRLSFGITVRNTRTSPSGFEFGSVSIPSGFSVSTSSLSVSGNHAVFPDPFTFVPERWLGSQASMSKSYECAFGRGSRKCIGINLAHAELYLCLATLLGRFEMTLFETDETDVAFKHDFQVAHPKFDSKGVRVLVERR